jgi:superfamily II DNA or RNA helicase
MSQWQEEIVSRSPLAAPMVGTLGGGSDDKFDGSIRILICVLNSAARKLPDMVRHLNTDHALLMIVDECHRAGASEMRRIFETPRQFTLGLSATPERDDSSEELDTEINHNEANTEKNEGILEREIGPIFFEMSYAQAIEQGVLPTFSIEHYALSLTSPERQRYEALSQEISDLRQQLETRSRRGLALIRWCRSAAGSKDPRSRRLIGLIAERKQFLYRIGQRAKAVERILTDALTRDARSRVIIFHESIAEVMSIFARLRRLGYRAVAEHSEFSDRIRAQAISLFRLGTAQIIVSAKSLIEGFNVPSADIGIVVAASSSVRQRVQTLGRLLRRGENEDAKRARLIVLFAENTVDDMIYEKADWNGFVGAERNEYFRWPDVENMPPIRVADAPREYIPADFELDSELLKPGQNYPGKLDGDTFTVDTGGTVLDARNRPIKLNADMMVRWRDFRGGGADS